MTEQEITEIVKALKPAFQEQVIRPLVEKIIKETIERELKPGGILHDS